MGKACRDENFASFSYFQGGEEGRKLHGGAMFPP